MLVKMLVSMAGHRIAYDPGHEVDFADDVAERLIARGYAAPVTNTPAPKLETADRPRRRETRASS